MKQGDVLRKDENLSLILQEQYPTFFRSDYTHFIVLTQSCDLVRRDEKRCKAKHISLAAVRPFTLTLELELNKHQNDFAKAAMVCSQNKRINLEQFLESLLNNNEGEYFYLHGDPDLEFPEPSCAFLRLLITLESEKYYDYCFNARILSLTDVFQAKLGWLVGNMYSRVGTEDWVPDHLTQEEFNDHIKTEIDALCPWIPDKQLKEAIRKAPDGLLTKDRDTIRKHVDGTPILSKKEEAIKRVVELLTELGKVKDGKDEKLIRNRLTNDPNLSTILK